MSKKAYYQKNREVILNKAKDYYENNKEKLREQARNKYRNLLEEEKIKKQRTWKKQISYMSKKREYEKKKTDIIICQKCLNMINNDLIVF